MLVNAIKLRSPGARLFPRERLRSRKPSGPGRSRSERVEKSLTDIPLGLAPAVPLSRASGPLSRLGRQKHQTSTLKTEMSMSTTNPINTNPTQPNATAGGATFSPLDQEAVMTAIDTIRQKLPFLLNLTPTERKGLAKLGDKSRAFVLKAVDVATQNPEALPRSHSVQDVQNIADVFRGLTSIRLALQQLYKQVDDTTTKIGS